MPYHTASLPDPIRQQVEEFIEFLLWKHGQAVPVPSQADPQVFLPRWTGCFARVAPKQAKQERLRNKYA
jgi:hypothetical protein